MRRARHAKKAVIGLVLLLGLLTFCASDSEPTMARIVYYKCIPANSKKDCHTIVSTRNQAYGRAGYWGEIGDSLVVVIVHSLWDMAYWVPTKERLKAAITP